MTMQKVYLCEKNIHLYQGIGPERDNLMFQTAHDDNKNEWLVLTERERQFETSGWGYFPTEEAAYKLAYKLAVSARKRDERNRQKEEDKTMLMCELEPMEYMATVEDRILAEYFSEEEEEEEDR